MVTGAARIGPWTIAATGAALRASPATANVCTSPWTSRDSKLPAAMTTDLHTLRPPPDRDGAIVNERSELGHAARAITKAFSFFAREQKHRAQEPRQSVIGNSNTETSHTQKN